ncbi:hypothetical protein [Erythrobacter donghaensis]|uniref:hypothetical protein n=1 Tax=Erythrobacter donghaensis TaxID=267135 RepID=UPI000AC68C84|nr:hypothetical protein [Erythrobacter donghaensis]
MTKSRLLGAINIAAFAITSVGLNTAKAQDEGAADEAYDANVAAKTERADGTPPATEWRLAQLSLADRVLQHARDNGSAESWLAAANLYTLLGSLRSEDTGESLPAAPETFWSEAEAALADDPAALARMQRYKEQQGKNLVGSNGLVIFSVAPRPSGRVMRYRGGERATVQMRDPRGTARLTVYDQNGAVACQTDWSPAGQVCSWTPRWTGAFRLEVERRSGAGPVVLATS